MQRHRRMKSLGKRIQMTRIWYGGRESREKEVLRLEAQEKAIKPRMSSVTESERNQARKPHLSWTSIFATKRHGCTGENSHLTN